jgi:hypothetical protein
VLVVSLYAGPADGFLGCVCFNTPHGFLSILPGLLKSFRGYSYSLVSSNKPPRSMGLSLGIHRVGALFKGVKTKMSWREALNNDFFKSETVGGALPHSSLGKEISAESTIVQTHLSGVPEERQDRTSDLESPSSRISSELFGIGILVRAAYRPL